MGGPTGSVNIGPMRSATDSSYIYIGKNINTGNPGNSSIVIGANAPQVNNGVSIGSSGSAVSIQGTSISGIVSTIPASSSGSTVEGGLPTVAAVRAFTPSSSVSIDTGYDIIVLGGQSNMVGLGFSTWEALAPSGASLQDFLNTADPSIMQLGQNSALGTVNKVIVAQDGLDHLDPGNNTN